MYGTHSRQNVGQDESEDNDQTEFDGTGPESCGQKPLVENVLNHCGILLDSRKIGGERCTELIVRSQRSRSDKDSLPPEEIRWDSMVDQIGRGHTRKPQVPPRVVNQHSELLIRRYDRRANLHAVPQQERHVLSGLTEIEPCDFKGKRGIVGISVAQGKHLTTGDAVMVRQSIDMSEAPCLLCKRLERRKQGRRLVGMRLLGGLRLLDEHELASSEVFWNRMGCVRH